MKNFTKITGNGFWNHFCIQDDQKWLKISFTYWCQPSIVFQKSTAEILTNDKNLIKLSADVRTSNKSKIN